MNWHGDLGNSLSFIKFKFQNIQQFDIKTIVLMILSPGVQLSDPFCPKKKNDIIHPILKQLIESTNTYVSIL